MTAVDLSRKPYLTTAEAAAYLSITEKALRRRMQRGTIPVWCYSHLGRSLRFSRAALDELLTPEHSHSIAELRHARRLSAVRHRPISRRRSA